MDSLVPDYLDDPADLLISFPDIKAKTTDTLYQGGSIDKSPKGSVDEPIRPLVDLINRHPSFSTLSSCSGRISLFQPWKGPQNEEEPAEEQVIGAEGAEVDPISHKTTGTPYSGKGKGGWLLVSHEIIDKSQLLTIFQQANGSDKDQHTITGKSTNEEDRALMFKVEPMLLHVAASTHERGRQFLALALELGFRESGLVIPSKRSNHRVTVAVRGMSLALAVPLAFQGALKPSTEYLCALVDQSNEKMERNRAKLQRLFQNVQQNLFRTRGLISAVPQWQCNPLPDLNLWGHDAVVIPACGSSASASDIDVLVFGGYGQGPNSLESGTKSHCQRNGRVYCLGRREGQWDREWARTQPPDPTTKEPFRMEELGVVVRPTIYTPREGSTVLPLGNFKNDNRGEQSRRGLVVIWGGRRGPQNALDEFLLHDHGGSGPVFVAPVDVRGEPPEARWGHSLTRLNLSCDKDSAIERLALLLGGRNTKAALNTAHVLSLIRDDDNPNGIAHFLWTTVTFPPDLPQPSLPFHHATVALCDADSACVFVFGGQSDPCNLLEAFSSRDTAEVIESINQQPVNPGPRVSSFTLRTSSSDSCVAQRCNLSASATIGLGVGAAVNVLDGWKDVDAVGTSHDNCHVILVSGGAPSEMSNHQDVDQNSPTLRLMELARIDLQGQPRVEWTLQPSAKSIPLDSEVFQGVRESILVHHRALALPSVQQSEAEVLLLGGGMMGFAFAPCFSR